MLTKITPELKTSVPPMEMVTFLWLLRFAFVCYALIWGIDYYSGIIVSFDAVAYPMCMTAFLFIYVAAKREWLPEEFLHFCTYAIIAGFLTASSVWHHMTPTGKYSNSVQWLGLNYVMAYLFLDVRKAAITTIIVLLITLIGHFFVVKEYNSVSDTLGVILNIGIAHMVYIVLLWTVLKMRVRVTQANERLHLLEHYSLIDPLTRALNRRGIEDTLHRMENQPPSLFAMVLIDIDHFKLINDQYGHIKGDVVLKGIVKTIQQSIHVSDELGRWGGEEFLLITVCQTHQQVLDLAEVLRYAVQSEQYIDEGKVTISLGISYSDQVKNMDELFHMADQNLYIAKQKGRNQIASSIPIPHAQMQPLV